MIATIPRPTTPAEPAAAPTVLSTSLPTIPDDFSVLAATDDLILVRLPADYDQNRTSLSKDGGRTWTKLGPCQSTVTKQLGPAAWPTSGRRRRVGTMVAYSTDLDNGDWGELWNVAAMATKATLATNGRLVRAGRANAAITFAALPKSATKPSHRDAFTSDSSMWSESRPPRAPPITPPVDVARAKSVGPLILPTSDIAQRFSALLADLIEKRCAAVPPAVAVRCRLPRRSPAATTERRPRRSTSSARTQWSGTRRAQLPCWSRPAGSPRSPCWRGPCRGPPKVSATPLVRCSGPSMRPASRTTSECPRTAAPSNTARLPEVPVDVWSLALGPTELLAATGTRTLDEVNLVAKSPSYCTAGLAVTRGWPGEPRRACAVR